MNRIGVGMGRVNRFALIAWAAMLVSTGTYFRIRPDDVAPDLDWLVIARIVAGSLAGISGL